MRALFSRPLLMLSTSNWMLWTSYGHWQTMNNTVVFDVPSRWIKLWNFTQILEFFTVQSLRVIYRHIIRESAVAGEIQGSQDWCRLLTKYDDNTRANVTFHECECKNAENILIGPWLDRLSALSLTSNLETWLMWPWRVKWPTQYKLGVSVFDNSL